MAVLLDQFIETLSQSGLMTADEVEAFLDGLADDQKPQTAEELAKTLFRHGKLTKFQAQCIYQGKTKGLVLGNYVVLDKIGQGGMGCVYKARHKRMKRVVALKVLPSHVTRSRHAAARFQREVEAAAQLNHPNIVTAYDADEADGVHFFVMEHVEGEDLAQTVIRRGPLPVQEAVDYTIQAARGLQYAHDHGVVHRDIKPANLLLDRKGTVKILDMGLARLEKDIGADDSTAAAPLTQSGQTMGTFDYMAPEQAEDARQADHRADVYSLGCTLFYLLTGGPVYAADTVTKKILAHREEPIPSISAIRRGAPEALDAAFQRMVAKRPADRQQSMDAVIAELEAVHSVGQQAQTETYSPEPGPRGGDDTDGTLRHAGDRVAPDDSALEDWLQAELPATPTQLRTKPGKTLQPTKRQMLYGMVAAAICFAVLLVFAVVIRRKTPEGAMMARVGRPDADVSGPSRARETHHAADSTFHTANGAFHAPYSSEIQAAEGKHTPDPAAWKALLPGDAPGPAIAPFDAATAKKHQQAWADYLGVPVEREIDLPGDAKLAFVLIPPGEFLMGSTHEERARLVEAARAAGDRWAIDRIPHEGPQHRVRITRPFHLGRHEVTVGQFRRFVAETGYTTEAERDSQGGCGRVDGERVVDPRFVWSADPGFEQTDDHPVVNVSWNDATAFCQWLSKKQDAEYALPTEAQWEFACRAGTTTFWHSGQREAELREYDWFHANSGGRTHPVGQLRPNAFGIHDMHGNVLEWCADFWAADYYRRSLTNDPIGPPTGSSRTGRGGSWDHLAWSCRSTIRGEGSPDHRFFYLGFRVASVLPDE